ncbi:MAG TPA: hypothetical protein PKG71_00830 [Candidatus Woesebacteria bacterium]|nr:hypothetical protein [Candidatus Woesebacteria bacterium]HNS94496.1 hypothetical protein [Candidatus Woesebacteria bacterium]
MDIEKRKFGQAVRLTRDEIAAFTDESIVRDTIFDRDGKMHRHWKSDKAHHGAIVMQVCPWQLTRRAQTNLLEEAAINDGFPVNRTGFSRPAAGTIHIK